MVSPSAPTRLGKRIEFLYANRLVLEWKAPENFGGLPQVTYSVYSVEPSLNSTSLLASGIKGREFEILNPLIGFVYQFQVSASNAWGESALSDIFEITYMTEPGQVTGVRELKGSRMFSSTFIVWDIPQNAGFDGSLTYILELKEMSKGISSFFYSIEEPKWLLEDLEDEVQYRIKVQAINDFGAGSLSAPFYLNFVNGVQYPKNFREVRDERNSTQVVLTWDSENAAYQNDVFYTLFEVDYKGKTRKIAKDL